MEIELKEKTQDASTEDKPSTINANEFAELKKQNDELLKTIEHIQKAQAGSDKKVTELSELLKQKEVEVETVKQQKENEKLTDVERLTNQINSLQNQLAEDQKKSARVEFLNMGYKLATARELPTSLVDNYGGNPDGLEGFLDSQKEFLESQVNKSVEERFGKGGHKPKGGAEIQDKHDWKNSTDSETNIKAFADEFGKYFE